MATAAMQTTTPTLAQLCATDAPTQRITLLITTFPGLGLPRTLSIPVASKTPIRDVLAIIYARLPSADVIPSLVITTTANKLLRNADEQPISTLSTSANADFLPLRITARLCGGKGGFGSQLRAAGGRMSSRKNRDRQNQNGSNRNLDGRRLRTIDEAKKLAEYLATKPEMDKRERDERRKRWEAVIDAAEATEAKIKAGKMGSNGGRLDAEYVESKEAAEEKVREAVQKAMREQMAADGRTGSESSAEDEDEGSESDEDGEESGSSGEVAAASTNKDAGGRSFYGWDDVDDDDDEEISDEEEEEQLQEAEVASDAAVVEGKGKGKVV